MPHPETPITASPSRKIKRWKNLIGLQPPQRLVFPRALADEAPIKRLFLDGSPLVLFTLLTWVFFSLTGSVFVRPQHRVQQEQNLMLICKRQQEVGRINNCVDGAPSFRKGERAGKAEFEIMLALKQRNLTHIMINNSPKEDRAPKTMPGIAVGITS